MSFRRFSDDEGLQFTGRIFQLRRNTDAERDRISPHCQAANAVNANVQVSGDSLDQLPANAADEDCSPRVLSRLFRINVEITFGTRSQSKRTAAHRLFFKDPKQFVP